MSVIYEGTYKVAWGDTDVHYRVLLNDDGTVHLYSNKGTVSGQQFANVEDFQSFVTWMGNAQQEMARFSSPKPVFISPTSDAFIATTFTGEV